MVVSQTVIVSHISFYLLFLDRPFNDRSNPKRHRIFSFIFIFGVAFKNIFVISRLYKILYSFT